MATDDRQPARSRSIRAWLAGLVAPRSADDDTRRREFVLAIILLLATVLWAAVLIAATIQGLFNGRFPDWPVSLTILAVLLGMHHLVRKGHHLISAWVLILIFAGVGIPYLAGYWGTQDGPAVLSALLCAMVIVLAGILLGRRSTILVAALVMAEVIGFGIRALGIANGRPGVWPSAAPDILVLLFPLGLITLASLLSSRQVEKSLLRARLSERDLRLERDNLERTVAARSRQIQELQDRRLQEEVSRAVQEARYDDRIIQYRRLHDTVLGTLTALSQGGLDIQRDDVRARAGREADYLRNLLMGEDTVAHGRSLHEALREAIEDVAALGLRIDYLTDAVPADLPERVVVAFASATREALTNVVRHSGTRQAWLTSTGEVDGRVVVRIVDRGSGFLPQAATAGLGLRESISRRVTEAGGGVLVDSQQDEGTLIELSWPRASGMTDGEPA